MVGLSQEKQKSNIDNSFNRDHKKAEFSILFFFDQCARFSKSTANQKRLKAILLITHYVSAQL